MNQIDESNMISIHGNLYPAVEGTNVTFSCPPGLVLTGPNTSTCMRNGEWEPDPQYLKCLGDYKLATSIFNSFDHMFISL